MQVPAGQVVFSGADDDGPVQVVDEGPLRTLHFGSAARQSTMFLQRPWALALSYSQLMVLPLLFIQPIRAVLVLGLGGGSLPKFLLHVLPDCRVDAVEKRPLVVRVAREFFQVPDDPRLCLNEATAERFVATADQAYDLILVDLYDRAGMGEVVGEPGFLADCRARLRPGGGLAINLWTGARAALLRRTEHRLEEAFAGRVLYLPVAHKRNTVALALTGPCPQLDEPALVRRAATLEAAWGLPFSAMLSGMARYRQGWP
jgi:spermidine synthase